jgi:hypothetical protein
MHPLALLSATLLLGSTVVAPADRIPPFRGESFSGATVTLPADLHGHVGILVLGFSQSSREAVTLWGTRLAHESPAAAAAAISYYEIPVLASVPRVLRGFVAGRIRADVAEAARPHFVPLLDHVAVWRALAHYSAPDDAYILLVDGQGTVRWQTQGPPTDATYTALRQQLAALEAFHITGFAK